MTDSDAVKHSPHLLQFIDVELVGGGRAVSFDPSLNFITGDITTGKTTLVRLMKAMVGSVPKQLPPECETVSGLRGGVMLGAGEWQVYRPLTLDRKAPVEVSAEKPDTLALRFPAAGEGGYGEFLLEQLSIPIVSVPRARSDPLSELSPVTINDWLSYCVVTGDELDAEVFGYPNPFRDLKRRWVFEIAYGLFDVELANLAATLKRLDQQIAGLESEAKTISKFLADSPISDRVDLDVSLAALEAQLSEARKVSMAVSSGAPLEKFGELRQEVLQARAEVDHVQGVVAATTAQLLDLRDLSRQLRTVSDRLTRAIVTNEWMVDFEFVVCPRCGSAVKNTRAEPEHCYLCLQPEPSAGTTIESLVAEQERVTNQIAETDGLVAAREEDLESLDHALRDANHNLGERSAQLDLAMATFVSAHATELQAAAAEVSHLETSIEWTRTYIGLVEAQEKRQAEREFLEAQKADLEDELASKKIVAVGNEARIRRLEDRMLDYLLRLHVPQLGDLVTVVINRQTYLPEVSGRTFTALSSQGLKTLVNVAHALAHHTIAIDEGLPLPGLLILDGVSANSGGEDMDIDRVDDMYTLFSEIASEYRGRLQLVIVDNVLPAWVSEKLASHIVLRLSQNDRLIRSA